MDKDQYIAALEIGSSKVVGAIATKSSSGYIAVKHVEEMKIQNCVRYGIVQNVDGTRNAINSIVKKLENRIDGYIKDVYVGVSGRSLHSVESEVSRNLDSSSTITASTINKILDSAVQADASKSYDIIDVVPYAIAVDNQPTSNPVGQFGSNITIKFHKIVAKTPLMNNLRRLMDTTSLHVKKYIVTPLAVGEEILQTDEMTLGCMLVDLGAETTEVSIYKNDALAYLITLPMGGRNITRDMATGLKIMEDTAELVKKNINSPLNPNAKGVMIEGVDSAKAALYITARTGELVANIERQISNANLKPDDLRSVVLIGGGALLKGFAGELENTKSKIKVRLGSSPAQLNIEDHSINRPTYIEAFSLLAKAAELMGDDETCVELNSYDNGGFNVNSTPTDEPANTKPAPDPEPTNGDGGGKRNNWKKWLSKKMDALFTENDNDDE